MTDQRSHDMQFEGTEMLYRHVRKSDLTGVSKATGRREVKMSSLRLQISMCRQKHGGESAPSHDPGRTGIVGIAASAAEVTSGHVRSSCIDDPTGAVPSHALIAVHAPVGSTVLAVDVDNVREAIAKGMSVVLDPAK